MRTKFAAVLPMALGLRLSACGTTMEQKAATEVATEAARKP